MEADTIESLRAQLHEARKDRDIALLRLVSAYELAERLKRRVDHLEARRRAQRKELENLQKAHRTLLRLLKIRLGPGAPAFVYNEVTETRGL